jgi:type I restriction enzyme M protein
MSITTLLKRLKDIMRGDAGVGGNEQRLMQTVWVLFLKIFDYKEEEWELEIDDYEPIIPVGYRWRDWATSTSVKDKLTGEELIEFVNNKLFHVLSGELIKNDKGEDELLFNKTDSKSLLVKEFMKESSNFMKNGVLLRQLINLFDEIDFSDYNQRHAFNDIYEQLLKGLQKDDGEFYTPRAITQFITERVKPKIGDSVADFACGTGGFLIDALNYMLKDVKTTEDNEILQSSLYGVEKKQLPFMLCTTNLMLNNIGNPNILHDNSLETNVRSYTKDEDKFDVILMNPPYGGSELEVVQKNFPADLRNSETADLFMIEILYRLRENGRCGIVLPDGFLFGTDKSRKAIKKKLMNECNLHTVIRLPKTCFAPYTDIATNLLFFDKTGKTEETWFYRMDMEKGHPRFNMKKWPLVIERFHPVEEWWNNRIEIKDEKDDDSFPDTWKAKKLTYEEIEARDFDIAVCNFPNKEDIILSPVDTIKNYRENREYLDLKLNEKIDRIIQILGV